MKSNKHKLARFINLQMCCQTLHVLQYKPIVSQFTDITTQYSLSQLCNAKSAIAGTIAKQYCIQVNAA